MHHLKRYYLLGLLLLALVTLSACIAPAANPAPATADTTPTPVAASATEALSTTVTTVTAPTPSTGPATIQHEGGETTFTTVPQRVIVLEYSFADALFALDLQPIGYADDGVPAYLLKLLKATTAEPVGTRNEPNLELIARLKPDLIIADTTRHTTIYAQLNQIAPTVIFDSYRGSYETQIEIFEKMSQIFHKEALAKQVIADARQAFTAAQKLAAGHERNISVGVLAGTGFTAHSNASYMGTLLAGLGLPTALEPLEGKSQFLVDLEGIVTLKPEAIVVTCSPEDRGLWGEWTSKPVWQQLDAVKNQRVYVFNRDLWSKSRGLLSLHLVLRDAETSGLLAGESSRSVTCPDAVEE
ncbi:MAG: ABC transporter substrate-binding protein [Chloroflexi bacterium]|nr:ABC transporter substrate-binding protein [Chloroflexota bacterium]